MHAETENSKGWAEEMVFVDLSQRPPTDQQKIRDFLSTRLPKTLPVETQLLSWLHANDAHLLNMFAERQNAYKLARAVGSVRCSTFMGMLQ